MQTENRNDAQILGQQNGITRRDALIGAAAFGATGALVSSLARTASAAVPVRAGEIDNLPRVTQKLVAPPFLPKHEQVTSVGPRIVEIRLVVEEKPMVIDEDGTVIQAMTFNGSVPGPLIVVHEGDYVELTLVNPEANALEHNIDFHAATGAIGGGALSHVFPGEEAVIRWKATKAGVFVYHCAPGGSMIPWHVVTGMNGAIMVLPRDGLKDRDGRSLRYDCAYYIGEQDFYVPRDADGEFKTYEDLGDSFFDTLEVMRGLIPSHVVFNGSAGALSGDNALTAKVGETVLFIHSQANRDTRPHLIGGHGEYVWETGSFDDPPATNLETWFVRGGSAGAAMYTFKQPGLYAYLNHNLIEAIELGAVAHVEVEGEWNDDLMVQLRAPNPILGN